MAAKFKCFHKALYMGKEVEIRGVCYGHTGGYKSGVKYDVRINSGLHSYDYHNVPESHLKEIPKSETNEVLQIVAEHNRLAALSTKHLELVKV